MSLTAGFVGMDSSSVWTLVDGFAGSGADTGKESTSVA